MRSQKTSLLIDRNGTVRFASCSFCDLIHVDFKKVGGQSIFDFIFPDDKEVVKAQLECSKSTYSTPFRLKLKRSDDAPILTEFELVPIKTASGDVYAMTATVTVASDPPNRRESASVEFV